MIDVGPDLPGFAALWREVAERFASGAYRPLPYTAFALTHAREAFDFMARAKHLGKVVLTVDDLATLRRHAVDVRAPGRGPRVGGDSRRWRKPVAAQADCHRQSAAIRTGRSSTCVRNLANDYVAPGDEVEIALAAIWQELLGIEQVGARDNFFDLNGDSLLAAQVTARVPQPRGAAGRKLPLSVLFDAPTIAALAGARESGTACELARRSPWPARMASPRRARYEHAGIAG